MSGYVITVQRGDPPQTAIWEVTDARLLTVIAVLDDPGNPKPLNLLRKLTKGRNTFTQATNAPPSAKLFWIAEGDVCEVLERAEDETGKVTGWCRLGRIWRDGQLRKTPTCDAWANIWNTSDPV